MPDIQRLLWRLITAPKGVAAALDAADARGDHDRAALARTVRGHAGLDPVQRLDVYANMYFFRLLDVLKDDYPATRALLGDVPFHNLVTDYVLRFPPAHFSIREAGRHLPELLDSHEARTLHPCAADLARFERALNDAFDAADAEVLTTADLAALPAEAWAELRLALHPSVGLLAAGWPVHEVRTAVDGEEEPAEPDQRPVALAVWRQELAVRHRELTSVELETLDLIREKATFAEVCAAVMERDPEVDAAVRVASLLGRWVSAGWFTRSAAIS